MRPLLFSLLPLVSLFAQGDLESQTMLFQAEEVARRFTSVMSRAAPPSLKPQTDELLSFAANWFTIDLNTVKINEESTLATLSKESLWEQLSEIGIQAVELKGLKSEDGAYLSLKLNPKWGSEAEYAQLAAMAMKHGIHLMGTLIGGSTGKGADFALALKNYRDYPGLYAMVEIDPKDWSSLPKVQPNSFSVNIPWMTLQNLQKMGYVPKDYLTYVKESEWNVTEPISGVDGKSRRWIYLRDAKGYPRLDWLRPSFASERLAAGDALQNIYRFGQKIMELDPALPESAREDLSLTIRKMGAYTAAHVKGGVLAFKEQSADLFYDHLTPLATFHAFVAEDAEVLRILYRLLLEKEIQPKVTVHSVQPFRGDDCDWAEFLAYPRKKYKYYEQEMTGEVLRRKLLQDDLLRLTGDPTGDQLPLSTWAGACDSTLSFEDLDKRRDIVLASHLLVAKFFAWQPGAFALSAEELMGATRDQQQIDLIGYNCKSLYPCLSAQMKNPGSFAYQLKTILRPRHDYAIERAELIDVPDTTGKAVLILRYRLAGSGFPALLAVNFGPTAAQETLDAVEYVKTSAINLSTLRSESKFFDSSLFELKLDPLSAKLILFQPTYYK